MKKRKVWVMMVMMLVTGKLLGQLQSGKRDDYTIVSDSLPIGYSKTTTLVFPYSVKSVDRGSAALLVQKVKGLENIIQIKAAQHDFAETNLTVITSDGQLYSFVLHYNEQAPLLNLVIGKEKPSRPEHADVAEMEQEAVVQSYAALASYEKKKLRGVKDSKYGMTFQLNGLYIHENVIFCRVKVVNRSNVNYDISQLRFFIRDQKIARRTASQEVEIKTSYWHNSATVIAAQSEVCFVFALAKFTLPDKKYLALQLMESNGGRHLELQVKNKKLMQIAVLPVL